MIAMLASDTAAMIDQTVRSLLRLSASATVSMSGSPFCRRRYRARDRYRASPSRRCRSLVCLLFVTLCLRRVEQSGGSGRLDDLLMMCAERAAAFGSMATEIMAPIAAV